MRKKLFEEQSAWVICLKFKGKTALRNPEVVLEEMKSLARALPAIKLKGASFETVGKINPGTLFGSGKIDEIRKKILLIDIKLILIDGALTPVQQRNLEKAWSLKVLDKTALIIEIFSDRAKSREGVLQVELAALTYQRTRLVRAWTHLERQRGGLGFVGGPGETQIESDRRAIDSAIVKIKKNLEKIVKTRRLHRSSKERKSRKIISLVGYTNSGKSTIFNHLTGANVFAKDMLFATLDPTVRSFETPDHIQTLLSDTVGFISDLPTELIAAFSATLEEVLSSDLILHVRDISHKETYKQFTNVNETLETIGIPKDKNIIEVWNKADLLSSSEKLRLLNVLKRRKNIFLVSGVKGEGFEKLVNGISKTLNNGKTTEWLRISLDSWDKRLWLYKNVNVLEEAFDHDELSLKVDWTSNHKEKYLKRF
ncbi:MAG: GTPase HflX [Paracoccaceae bacterium]